MQKVVIYRNQADDFHEINGISAFILPQSENISVTKGRVVATFCMSSPPEGTLKAFYRGKTSFPVVFV